MVSVDGDTSTNDTVLLLANGLAGNPEIKEKNEDYQDIQRRLLNYINTHLRRTSQVTARAQPHCSRSRSLEPRAKNRQ